MSRAWLIPLVGLLAVMAIVPGALGCRAWDRPPSNEGGGFNTLTAPGSPPAVMIALVILPLIVAGAFVALSFATAKPTSGRWVSTGTRWVWVPNRK